MKGREGMKITKEEIQNIAILSRLEVKDEVLVNTEKALNNILDYVAELNELKLDEVEPMVHAVPISNVFRKDEVKPSLDRTLALQNAPEECDGYFKVPRVVQE